MGDTPDNLPEDIEALQAALLVTRAELASVRAQQSDDHALIAHLKLQIEKLNRVVMTLARSVPQGCWISSN
ncbi:capsule polysaccharide export protein KpsE/RkpR [Bradyrhizobium niftali]